MIERDAGAVKRFHTVRTIGNQTVAEHSFNVAMILLKITQPSAELLKAALYHDLPEIFTGDIPATTKWRHSSLAHPLSVIEENLIQENQWGIILTDEEKLLLKYADMLELVLYCAEQMLLGNSHVQPIFARGLNYLAELPDIADIEVSKKVQALIDNACGVEHD